MRPALFLSIVLLVCSIGFGQTSRPSAMRTVEEFYRTHFLRADRMNFEPENVRHKRKWLTPALYRLLLSEFRREAENAGANPELTLKPRICGDIFTDSESPPQVFRAVNATQSKGRAIVTVFVYWNDETVGRMKRKIKVVLISSSNRWLIDNLIYEDDKDLITKLKSAN